MNRLLFFKPIPKHTIWGGTAVKDYFNYSDFDYGVGQTWVFSDQENESNICVSDNFKGKSLNDIWTESPEIFNSQFEIFPVIISLVGPSDDLSIQLHPNEVIAQKKGFSFGKNEAWYFIKADNSSLVYGNTAKNNNELISKIINKEYNNLFKTHEIKQSDFVYIPSGTIHALGKKNIVYEVQQSTDLTYRIYDYNRTDNSGKKRELHLKEAIEVLKQNVGENDLSIMKPNQIICNDNLTLEQFISNKSFTILKLASTGDSTIDKNGYWLCTVIKGQGSINKEGIKLGDNFIISATQNKLEISGNFILMITSEESYKGDV